jgi:polyphenol oxidase
LVDAATLTERRVDGLRFLVDDTALARGVMVAFSDRNGGVGSPPFDSLNVSVSVGDREHAETNRGRIAAALGFDAERLAQVRQVHGATVLDAPAGCSGVQGEGDGLVAEDPGVVLGILTADCVPVLLEGERGVAALHAGWRGLVAGVLERGVEKVGPVRAAWVGPSIHACCYEVGEDVTGAFGRAGLPVVDERHVDPADAARAALQRCGVGNLAVAVECTSCDRDYFSYRRDGITGRQGSFIAITERP